MSPRAACLLDLYGFGEVYDYVDGKSDWMAYGLDVEGEDGPFVGQAVEEVPTCRWDQTAAEVRSALAEASAHHDHHEDHDHDHHDHHDHGKGRQGLADMAAVVLGPDNLAIGAIDADTLVAAADHEVMLDLLQPVPTTIRPSTTMASLTQNGDDRALVTTSDGRLLGQVVSQHPAGGTGHDDADDEIAEILAEVRERFGPREPSEEELRSFLHDRLVADGKTPEEADAFLAEVNEPD